jgi:hypothetical protein
MERARITALRIRNEIAERHGDELVVDFNPQTLRIGYRTNGRPGEQNAKNRTEAQSVSGQPMTFSASMSVELIYDTSRDGSNVQNKTRGITSILRAVDEGHPPLIRFQWGEVIFDGLLQDVQESLELFSEGGVPLRATLSLSVSEEKLTLRTPRSTGAGAGGGSLGAGFGARASAGISGGFGVSGGIGAAVGTTPLTVAPSGVSLQALSARAGLDWRAVAAANGIDNPRTIAPGTVLDLQAGASGSVRASLE